MVICQKTETPENGRNGHDSRKANRFEGGPVFLPPRRPSPFAQALLAKSLQGGAEAPASDLPPRSPLGDGITSYDELWYLGRPRSS